MSMFQPLPGRDCGACTVCCVELDIDDPELKKPDEVRCPNLGAHGCGIYSTRPKTCRTWYCGWRLLTLSDRMRPDRSKVLLVPEMCREPGYEKGGLKIVLVEGRVDAIRDDELIDFTGRCVAAGIPIFLSYGAGPFSKRLFTNTLLEPATRAGDRAAFARVLTDHLARMVAVVNAEMAIAGQAAT